MAEEVTNVTTNSESGITGESTNTYIEAITEMKKNSVSKSDYDKLLADNKQLLDAIINGTPVVTAPQEAPKPPVDVDKLRTELFSPESNLSNLDYATKALELREALLNRDNIDIFAPYGANLQLSPEDLTGPQKLADALKSCIDYADGDSQLFTQELMRITKNDSPVMAAKTRR